MNVGMWSFQTAGKGQAREIKISVSPDTPLPDTPEAVKAILELSMAAASSIAALGPAMAAYRGTTSPQLARATQATENVWKGIEAEYRMLTSMDVAQLIGSAKSSRSLASDQRAAGKLIGIKRGNKYVYPGFQFDWLAGKVHQAIPGLIAMAAEVGWDDEDLVFWLISPSAYFGDDRPVDHLDDADLADKGRQSATVQW